MNEDSPLPLQRSPIQPRKLETGCKDNAQGKKQGTPAKSFMDHASQMRKKGRAPVLEGGPPPQRGRQTCSLRLHCSQGHAVAASASGTPWQSCGCCWAAPALAWDPLPHLPLDALACEQLTEFAGR